MLLLRKLRQRRKLQKKKLIKKYLRLNLRSARLLLRQKIFLVSLMSQMKRSMTKLKISSNYFTRFKATKSMSLSLALMKVNLFLSLLVNSKSLQKSLKFQRRKTNLLSNPSILSVSTTLL